MSERCNAATIMPKLSATPADIILAWILGAFSLLVILALLSAPPGPSKIAETMWLSANDLRELETTLQGKPILTSQEAAEVLTRQIRNLAAGQKPRPLPIAWLLGWKALLVLSPVIIIGISFSHLAVKCYPRAVFAWGDFGEFYETLVSRRKTVWNVIIGALLVGMVSNLFVLGLSAFLQR